MKTDRTRHPDTVARLLSAGAFIAAVFFVFAPAPGAEEPTPVGAALDAQIVSLFVPPTRSAEPCAATRQKVYAYDSKETRWSAVYDAPAGAGDILAVAGYAKSSQAVYIVHESGVAITHDAGKTWTDTAPDGFPIAPTQFVSLCISPTDRKQAVLASASKTWLTQDFGESWAALPLPASSDFVARLAYTGGDTPWLVALTSSGIYCTENLGKTWQGAARAGQGNGALAACSATPAAVVLEEAGLLRAIDPARPGYYLDRKLDAPFPAAAIASDCGGHGALWVASGTKLFLADLRKPGAAPLLLCSAKQTISNLVAHPRNPQAVYWSTGDQVWSYTASGPAAGLLAQAFPLEDFVAGEPIRSAAPPPPAADDHQAAEAVLSELLASQPPLGAAVEAALRYADYDPLEVEQWRKNVRRRNLLPLISVQAGERERAIREYGLLRNVDRYGVDTFNDIHHDDSIRGMDTYSVELRWELRGLLFDRDQVAISEEGHKRAEQRNALVVQISQLYYERIERLLEKRSRQNASSAKDALNLELRIRESTDLLNQLCGENLFNAGAEP